MSRRSTRIWVVLLALAFVLGAATEAGAKRRKHRKKRANMPDNWVWPPSAEMKASGKACREELTELGVEFEKAGKTKKVASPIVVPDMELGGLKVTPIFRKPPFVMDCHLALAIARYASLFLSAGITELRFSSIHDYRHVRLHGRTKSALSRHALGLAIDVYQFVTEEGDTIVVEDDYGEGSGARLLPLHIALVACRGFRAVLSPGNDPRSHDDHFHLEAKMVIEAPKSERKKPRSSKQAKRRKARRARKARKARKARRARKARKARRARRAKNKRSAHANKSGESKRSRRKRRAEN